MIDDGVQTASRFPLINVRDMGWGRRVSDRKFSLTPRLRQRRRLYAHRYVYRVYGISGQVPRIKYVLHVLNTYCTFCRECRKYVENLFVPREILFRVITYLTFATVEVHAYIQSDQRVSEKFNNFCSIQRFLLPFFLLFY